MPGDISGAAPALLQWSKAHSSLPGAAKLTASEMRGMMYKETVSGQGWYLQMSNYPYFVGTLHALLHSLSFYLV